MEVTYYFPKEYGEEERMALGKKAAWFLNREEMPSFLVCPKELLYDEEGRIAGYRYEAPEFPYLTMKELFQPRNIEKYHVDGQLLLTLAKKVLYLMSELSVKGIYAGFLTLDAIIVHRERPDKAVGILHPELFQAAGLPSDFPWYPSDSKLFSEDFDYFDEESQKKADAKLIYKILTASEKNNAKIPPNGKNQEYSFLFWNILSREIKDYFLELEEKTVYYSEMMDLILHSLEEESYYTAPEEKRITEMPEYVSREKETAYGAVVILREAEKSAQDVSRELYLLEERLEMNPHYEFLQAYILGDKHPFVRGFERYPAEYRSRVAPSIQSYSYGETLLIAGEVMEQALLEQERPSFLFIILDGEVRRDSLFLAGLSKIEELKRKWNTEIVLLPVREFKGEGYRMLCTISK